MALTPKQQLFIDEYLIDLNATQAAIRAGYSESSAQQIGAENLSKPVIAAAIQEALDRRAKSVQITAEDVLQSIKDIRDEARADKKNADALKANELLGKHLKLFTDKTEVTGKDGSALELVITKIVKRADD